MYRFALVTSDVSNPIFIRTKRLHPLSQEEGSSVKASKGWREPGLLSASRQIRKEAAGIYYGDNHFALSTSIPNSGKACEWLASRVRLVGAWPFESSIVQLVGNTPLSDEVSSNLYVRISRFERWSVSSLFSLAKLVYDTQLREALRDPVNGCKFWYACFGIRSVLYNGAGVGAKYNSPQLQTTLSEVIRLALNARLRQQPYAWLEQDFHEWAMSHLAFSKMHNLWFRAKDEKITASIKAVHETAGSKLPWAEIQEYYRGVAP